MALSDTPVVLLVGPRRSGKTTLAKEIGGAHFRYLTLDDPTTLRAALSDPVAFIRGLNHAVIDEVQRAPDLLLAIKKSIDEDYRPGRFLLTGSANVLMLPKVADSLAGRIEVVTLLPLAQCEIANRTPTFLRSLFSGKWDKSEQLIPEQDSHDKDVFARALCGGYPEVYSRGDEPRRRKWLQSYSLSVLTRDLRDIANIGKIDELPTFFRYIGNFSAQLANYSDLGSSINVTHITSRRYLSLLEEVYLVELLAPWNNREIKRLVKTPKLHFIDSGLLSATRGFTLDRLQSNPNLRGPLLETFVFSEIKKQLLHYDDPLSIYHFREQDRYEVDFVLERSDGQIAGVEVKATASVSLSDFSGLKKLTDACRGNFCQGIVLYNGAESISFGERLTAVPFSALWQ